MAVDDTEFSEFFASQYARLCWLGCALTGSPAQAEELAQEALVRIWWRWRLVGRPSDPASYARRVLVNRHRSLLRRAAVEARSLARRGPEELALPAGDERAMVLWQAVQALPVRQRVVLVLRFYEDRTEAEVAQLLGLQVGTVKSRGHRALARLRDQLGSPSLDPANSSSTRGGTMSLQHELRELFERIENAPWPAEREAFDRFLRRKRRRGRVMAVGVALTLAVVVGAAVLVPGMLSKDVEQVVPVAPRGTPMRIPDQGFQLVAPSGWKVSRKMTGPTPGFAIRPMVMGVVLTPRSGTLSGATITVTTEAHEPDWQGASRRPDGRQYLWRPNSDRDLVGQYAIQWPNYCKQDPITIITTCTGTRQARASLVTGYAPGGNAEVREQVQQPMQQIALSVQPITNALPPSPSPPDLLQTKVLLGNGGRGTASWEAWLEPRDGKPGFAVRFPQAKPRPIRHWQQLDPSILNAQGTSSVLQCLSWMPGYGVIVIGLARADTATVHIELNKRPLVHVPVFGRDRSVPVVAFASPRLRPAFVLVNRVTAVDAAGRMLGTENRKGRSPCRGAMSNVGRP